MRGDRARRNRRHKVKRKKFQDKKQRSKKSWEVAMSKKLRHQDKQRRAFRKQIEIDRFARSHCALVLVGDVDNLFL